MKTVNYALLLMCVFMFASACEGETSVTSDRDVNTSQDVGASEDMAHDGAPDIPLDADAEVDLPHDMAQTDATTDPDTDIPDMAEVFAPISLQSEITEVQPMTGIVIWESSWNSHAVKQNGNIQLEYSYISPASIVTARSTYDWAAFDAFLDRIAGRGHQAIVRFYYTYPGRQTAVPNYIKNLPGYDEEVGTTEGQATYFPDWSHPELQRAHLEFYEKFAERYDDDPRLAFLQVGFGLWGEYHIYEGPRVLGVNFPSKTFQTTFLNQMARDFKKLHWSVSIDAASSTYSPFSQDAALKALKFGNFDDSFMHQNHSGYNTQSWNFFDHTTRYHTSPHGGELSYYSDFDQENALNPGGIYGRTYEQLSAQFHISYMIGNDQPEHQSVARIKEAGMANGYKFEILSFEASPTRSIVEVGNFGIAPIYYDAFVAINGVRATDSLLGLWPGQTRSFTIPSGGPAPTLTIESDRLVSTQKIQFRANL